MYKVVNRTTGQFYFGHRRKNVDLGLQSCDDLWKVYFTSSKIVKKMNWEDFDPFILAEFASPEDAIRYEQKLLDDAWGSPLLLNRARIQGDKYHKLLLCNTGNTPSEETLAKRSASLKKVIHTPEWVHKISVALTGKKIFRSEETNRSYREKRVGKKWNEDSRQRLSVAQLHRFESEEQRELNRKAGEAGYRARKKDFKKIRVLFPSGEEKTYDCLRDFYGGRDTTRTMLYQFVKRGTVVQKGSFAGYTFQEISSEG